MHINEYHKKALEKIENGQHSDSIEDLNKALEANPDHPTLLSERGVVYFHLKKYALCMSDMDRAVQMESDYGYRYASRAYIRSNIGDIDGAITDYEMAIKLDPEDSLSHNNLGLIYEKKGYDKQSKGHFEKADLLAQPDVDQVAGDKPQNISSKQESEKERSESEKEMTQKKIMKKALTDKSTRKEFWSFIKNGFKIKKENPKNNDEAGKS